MNVSQTDSWEARWRKLRWLLLPIILLGGAGLTFYATLTLLLGKVESVTMPVLEGQELVSALESLSRLQLSTRIERLEYSDKFEKGHVIVQTPPAGRTIKVGRTVMLVVSKGLQQVTMMDLVGLEQPLAEQILKNNGMQVQRFLSACSVLPAGRISAQYPVAGDFTLRDEPIQLAVSNGSCSNLFVMPDFRGRGYEQVTAELDARGVAFVRELSDEGSGDRVVGQQPAAGTVVGSGDPLNGLVRLTMPRGFVPRRDERIKLHYVRYMLPYGFLRPRLTLKFYLPSLDAVEIDIPTSPGKNVEWIAPSVEGLPPEVLLDEQRQSDYALNGRRR